MKIEMKTRKSSRGTEVFKTKIESWMIPSVNMIVIAHSVFGEFIYDAIKVPIKYDGYNQMIIKIQPENQKDFVYRPGQNLNINYLVKNNNDNDSSLHLLSVDERVRYFGNHNDITLENVRNVIGRLGKNIISDVSERFDDRYNDLSKFNALFITNAYINDKDCSFGARSEGVEISKHVETIDEGSKRSKEILTIRREFPETFIFKDIPGTELRSNEYMHKTLVPDSITKFFVSGFVFHPVNGIGIALEKSFTVFQDFFIKTILPHSIHVGEVLKLNVVAFNYKKETVKAEIKIVIPPNDKNDQQLVDFEFVKIQKNETVCVPTTIFEKSQTKIVIAESNKGSPTHFFIRVKSEGKITLHISATIEGRTDTIIKKLTVEPHGRRISKNTGHFIDLRKSNHTAHSFQPCKFPTNIVNNTKKVYATVYGHVLGQVLTLDNKLIEQPSGKCIRKITKMLI